MMTSSFSRYRCCVGLAFVLLILFIGEIDDVSAFTRSVSSEKKLSLFWLQSSLPIKFLMNVDGSPNISDKEKTFEAIEQGFLAWNNVPCSCFRYENDGGTTETEIGFDPERPEDNKNIIIFRTESWDHAPAAVAVTSTVYSQLTGQIVAFDMEFNSVGFVFSLDGGVVKNKQGREVYSIDLRNTATHEAGHSLGLDHSPIFEATMFFSGTGGDTSKRTLHQDDIQGLCAIYQKTSDGKCVVDDNNQWRESGCGCSGLSQHLNDQYSFFFVMICFMGLFFTFLRKP